MESPVGQQFEMTEETKRTDEEMENMLRLVISQNGGLNSETLSSLVSSIHNLFGDRTLHERYGHLIGVTKKLGHLESNTNGEFSITIFPESSNPEPNELSISEGRLDESFEAERANLQAIIAERDSTISRLEQEIHKEQERIVGIEVQNEQLLQKLEACYQQQTDLYQKIDIMKRENETLVSEKFAITRRMEDAEKSVREVALELDAVKDEKSKLQYQNSELQIQLDRLSSLLEAGEERQKSLAREKEQVVNDKCAAEAEVEDIKQENLTLKLSLTDVRSRNSELEINLEKKRDEVLQLQKELEDLKKNVSFEKEVMFKQANNLQMEINLLKGQKSEFGGQIQILAEIISEGNDTIDKLESNFTSRITTQEKVLHRQKHALSELTNKFSEIRNRMSRKFIEELDAKCERIHQLEMIVEERKRQTLKVEENHKQTLEKLKNSQGEKANANKEVVRLNELVQTLEVHLRLLDRKLKITKSEFKEKDETYKKRAKELQQKCTQLEEHCDALYEEIYYRENESEEVKGTITNEVGRLVVNFQTLELALEESCGHLHTRLSECSGELQILKKEFNALNSEKKRLEQETHKQTASLQGMKDEINSLKAKLAKKQEEGLLKDEEKREAIRQLCMLVEYHRENCDNLLKNLSANGKRCKPSA